MTQPKDTQMSQISTGVQTQPSIYSSDTAFDRATRMARQLAASDIVPAQYKGNLSNTMIALEMANRTGSSPIMVMQNLHVIQGKPSWSSSFIIAALNACGRFSPVRFRYTELGPKEVNCEQWEGPQGQRRKVARVVKINDKACVAYAYDQRGDLLEGPSVSVEMAVKEGWYTKTDSKWPTMTDLMLTYRAAAFFGRLYAPDVLMGMQTQEEITDVHAAQQPSTAAQAVEILNTKVSPTQSDDLNNAHIMDEEIQ